MGLRPACECCKAGAVKLTVGLEHMREGAGSSDWASFFTISRGRGKSLLALQLARHAATVQYGPRAAAY